MAVSLTEWLVPTYSNMLRTLSGLLDRAEAQARDGEVDPLLSARLADDMFPLSSQLRFAAFQAQEAVCRLKGEPVPDALMAIAAEGRAANDNPGTLQDARARLHDALTMLEALTPHALDDGETRSIALALPNGITFEMTGAEYARDWALPQFYFHVVTAYAVLRNHGVEIGKADYVPHMFAYVRSESVSAS